mgnify:CR=1 FL=1
MNTEIIWQKFLETIKNTLSDITYETWFKENKLIEFDENTIKILVNNSTICYNILNIFVQINANTGGL